MAQQPDKQSARFLHEDPIGVFRQSSPRRMQAHSGGAYYSYLVQSWVGQLNLDRQGAPLYHSLSLGQRPVIVCEPAIILQPAEIIEEESRKS